MLKSFLLVVICLIIQQNLTAWFFSKDYHVKHRKGEFSQKNVAFFLGFLDLKLGKFGFAQKKNQVKPSNKQGT